MSQLISKDLIRGHTDTIILNILDQGDSYGYQIAKKIRLLSHDAYELKEATLYSVFRRLEKNGDIRSYWGDETQGSRRKYYQITTSGQALLASNVAAWKAAMPVIDQLIRGRLDA